uniref:Filamin-B n=1 Tax=Aceria tosichella TaxID=561515 RepID=A0A6G1SPW0_9ACAR
MTDQNQSKPLHVTTFQSFPVNQVQSFNILFNHPVKPSDLFVSITNPQIGSLDKQLDWSSPATANGGVGETTRQYHKVNGGKCTVSFKAPIVGAYTIRAELLNQPNQNTDNSHSVQFIAKAYDLSKVFIIGSSGRCRINESYEFSVDASEAGEGQLEIAVNEGEIPNQVQVLDNGKCIVDFVPEEPVPHVVDIKFNGHNVNGCPFVVQVEQADTKLAGGEMAKKPPEPVITILEEPKLIKTERILVDSMANFELHNIKTDHLDKNDIVISDPENRSIDYAIIKDPIKPGRFKFEFKPAAVGDYSVELRPGGKLASELPSNIQEKFPFSMKVFDFNKVLVSNVTDGVIGHPIYFFIDASQAGSGNLEIRVSSKTRNVPNHPQSEANAKIRVNFTPTEARDHTIDVKFNGISVPNNPFLVKVAQYPQARLPITSQDILKYVAVGEPVEFRVDYLGNKLNELTNDSCSVSVLKPDFACVRIDDIHLVRPVDKHDQAHFKIKFMATKIGPYKLFIVVNNEILPGSPILSNVYNIHEVKVSFDKENANMKPVGKINEPVHFTVDASRAGEGTLALAVVSSQSSDPVPTSVNVSDKGHGLYNLSFIPTEFTVHSIGMSFNDRVVPGSPFVVDMVNSLGESALSLSQQRTTTNGFNTEHSFSSNKTQDLAHDMSALSLKSGSSSSASKTNKSSKQASFMSKEDEMLQSIVVHGVSLKRTPVNSTGAFIIETNKLAQARDFDVLIADPCNSMVDVQCYRDQGGNLIAEWTPIRVGTHKIEVLYRDKPVPGSPFMSEAFDPSGVQIEPLKTSQFTLDDLIEIKINRSEAGQADLEVVLNDPNGYEQTLELQTTEDDKVNPFELVSFRPRLPGKHRLTITFGGYEVPRSPLVMNVRDNRDPVKVSGTGLVCAEVNRTSQFNVESSSDGELKLRIECGDREIVPKVERKGRSYNIKYKPTDVGYATISIYWDGTHIDGSPFSVPVNDLSKFSFVNPAQNNQVGNQIALEYEPRLAREISLDTSKCGPGELRAEAYCRANPNIKFSIPVNHMQAQGRHKLTFTCPPGPEQLATGTSLKDFPMEATYLIRFYYNNLAVPETLASVVLSPTVTSRTKTTATSSSLTGKSGRVVQPVEQNNNSKPNSLSLERQTTTGEIIALRGHGLAEAKCGEEATFTIDGRSVGHGKPEVKFYCQDDEVRVQLELVEDNLYKATYVAMSEGTYTLNVLWDGKQVAGCPISVNVSPGCDSSKVICTADSLKGGVLGEEIKTFIDTRKAGPGELTALCTGPQKVAFCELLDRGDGTFVLYIKPQESGRHFLTINYGGQHIPKSPFSFKVSGKPDPTKVRVYGPGVEHGVLSLYQSRFVCDTRGAGAGQMTVRIRGPKGAFRIDTHRENRTILCKYDPTEPGDYRIEIKWSGRHVPGSPFSVMIFDTQEELNRFLLSRQQTNKKLSTNGAGGGGSGPVVGSASHHHHQVPSFQPTLVEYGHYSSSGVPPPAAVGGQQNSQFRLQ